MGGISNRNAALLCYIPMVGWITPRSWFSQADRFRRDTQVRFHAFQGFNTCSSPGSWSRGSFPRHSMSQTVSVPSTAWPLVYMLHLVIFVAWIVMIIKVLEP